jgi:hypothetical protein
MRGEQLRSSQVDALGVAGDRQHHLAGPEGRLGAQDLPRLARWSASFPFNPDGSIVPDRDPPLPLLTAPTGARTWRWGDPRLQHALDRDLGRGLSLVREPGRARGVIVSTRRPEEPVEASGVNVQLALTLPPSGWAGTELAFRDGVRLRLVASRADGPGIEARVVEAGRILLGEPVSLG